MGMLKIKTDEESIFKLCNSLNAVAGAMRCQEKHRLSVLLLTAQGTITKLYKENQELRKGKEAAK